MKALTWILLLACIAGCELIELDDFGNCNVQGHRLCNNICTDLTTKEHCGSCDNACKSDESCFFKKGLFQCLVPDTECENEGKTYCGEKAGCVMLDSAAHCGACNNGCGEKKYCAKINGKYSCQNKCESPNIVTDDGQCILPNTYLHCGEKNKYCPLLSHECVETEPESQIFECVDKCKNGRKDPGEVAVDCGGTTCADCIACSPIFEELDCGKGGFCDSLAGYFCSKRCRPDNGQPNTPSKDCLGEDQICRADGRCTSKYFTTLWRLRDPDDLTIELFYDGKGACDFDIDWGDGKKAHINDCTPENMRHTYAEIGTYQVKISGTYTGWGANEEQINALVATGKYEWKGRYQMKGILSFGPVGLGRGAFAGDINLDQVPLKEIPDASVLKDTSYMFFMNPSTLPIGNWDTRDVLTMSHMFDKIDSFNQPIAQWNTANVTDMSHMFSHATSFNQPITQWNTANVTDMSHMFEQADSFNQPIGEWNTANVTDMSHMFSHAYRFNQPIGEWNTANVTDMRAMFKGAAAFNQPIGEWNTANVTDMSYIFAGATAFNQPIGEWNTANVTDMRAMFKDAKAFDQPIGKWSTAKVTNMSEMFSMSIRFDEVAAFNQPIGEWNTANVTDMSYMFASATAFNQPIGEWNTANVTDMRAMFKGAKAFNQPIGKWSTAKVTNMSEMFSAKEMFRHASAFNQYIGEWNTANVTDMSEMFYEAERFNQDLSAWNIEKVTKMDDIFRNYHKHGISKENYCKLTKKESWRKFKDKLGIKYDC